MPAFHPSTQVKKNPQRRLRFRPLAQLPAQVEQEVGLFATHVLSIAAQEFVDDVQRAPPPAARRHAAHRRGSGNRAVLFDADHRR